MSGHIVPEEKSTLKGILIALVVAFTATPILVYLVVHWVMSNPSGVGDKEAITPEVVAANIKPVGKLVMAGSPEAAATAAAPAAAAPKAPRSGEQVVTKVCAACHASGALNAPKIGDNAAWAPHIAHGLDPLVKNAINGIRQMPPRGGAADLSDLEVARAVVYMTNKSGASFKEPAAPAAAAEAPKAAEPAPAAAPAPAAPAPAATAGGEDKGKKVYETTCLACHGTGAAGAPKIGDKAAWGPRIATGADALHASALKGKGVMPPKGGNAALSDDDVKAAVDYMVAQSR